MIETMRCTISVHNKHSIVYVFALELLSLEPRLLSNGSLLGFPVIFPSGVLSKRLHIRNFSLEPIRFLSQPDIPAFECGYSI